MLEEYNHATYFAGAAGENSIRFSILLFLIKKKKKKNPEEELSLFRTERMKRCVPTVGIGSGDCRKLHLRDELAALVAATFASRHPGGQPSPMWPAAVALFRRGVDGGLGRTDLSMVGRMVLNRVSFPPGAWQPAAAIFHATGTADGLSAQAVLSVARSLGAGGLWEGAVALYSRELTASTTPRRSLQAFRRAVSFGLMQDRQQWRRSVAMLRHELLHRDVPHVASAGYVVDSLKSSGRWSDCVMAFAALVRVVDQRAEDKQRWRAVFGLALEAAAKHSDDAARVVAQMMSFGQKHLGAQFVLDSRGHSAVSSHHSSLPAAQLAAELAAPRLVKGYAACGRWIDALSLFHVAKQGDADHRTIRELRLFVLRASKDPDATVNIINALGPLSLEEAASAVIWLRGSAKWRTAAAVVSAALGHTQAAKPAVDASPHPGRNSITEDFEHPHPDGERELLLTMLANLVSGTQMPWAAALRCLRVGHALLRGPCGEIPPAQQVPSDQWPRLLIGVGETLLRADPPSQMVQEAVGIIQSAVSSFSATLPVTCLAVMPWQDVPRQAVTFNCVFKLLSDSSAGAGAFHHRPDWSWIDTNEKTDADSIHGAPNFECELHWERAIYLCSCLAADRTLSDEMGDGTSKRHRAGPLAAHLFRSLRRWPAPGVVLFRSVAALLDPCNFIVDDDCRAVAVIDAATLLLRSARPYEARTCIEAFLPHVIQPKLVPRIGALVTSASGGPRDVLCAAETIAGHLVARVHQTTGGGAHYYECVAALCRLQKERDGRVGALVGDKSLRVPAWHAALLLGAAAVLGPKEAHRNYTRGALLTQCLSAIPRSNWVAGVRCLHGLIHVCDARHCAQFANVFGAERLRQHFGQLLPGECAVAAPLAPKSGCGK